MRTPKKPSQFEWIGNRLQMGAASYVVHLLDDEERKDPNEANWLFSRNSKRIAGRGSRRWAGVSSPQLLQTGTPLVAGVKRETKH